MRKYILGFFLLAGAIYTLHYLENEHSLKPTIQKSIVEAYGTVHNGPHDVVLLESNIPLKFILAVPGEVESLVRINGKTINVTHYVEFFGVTPFVSLITGDGMFRVRISNETHKRLQELKG